MSNLVLNAANWFWGIMINLFLALDWVVYTFINWLYRVFILVAKVDIFKDGTQIEAITRRIYIIVGIAMLFIFAYNLILLIVNPEGNQLGNMGKVVKNAIISIILVTFLPLIFSYMMTIQNHILDSNVIGRLVLGTSTNNDADNSNKNAGIETALTIFSSFYHPVDQSMFSCRTGNNVPDICSKYVDAYDSAMSSNNINKFIWDEDLKKGAVDGEIEYNWVISTLAGGFALWMFVSFVLDIGKRVGKLAFYEIISPIPVMMRIMPGDKMFDKWFKGIKDTYISLFVRLAIVYFSMYAITLVPDIFNNMWTDGTLDNPVLVFLGSVVIILGILMFAQEAPKLLSDIFSNGGEKIGLNPAKKLREAKPFMATAGMVGTGLGAMAENAYKSVKDNGGKGLISSSLGGLFGGARRGAVGGWKADSFDALGKNITAAKYEAAKARDARDTRTAERQEKGAVTYIKDGIGGIKDNIKDWIAGSNASEFFAKGINAVKTTNGRIKDQAEYNKKKVSREIIQSYQDSIRKGETVSFGNKSYNGKNFGDNVEAATKAIAEAVANQNRKTVADNYKNNYRLLRDDLDTLLKAFKDNRNAWGPKTEEELVSAISNKINDLKTSTDPEVNSLKPYFDKLISGDHINWTGMEEILSTPIEVLKDGEDKNAEKTRMALYELNDAIDKGMSAASVRNYRDAEKENKK